MKKSLKCWGAALCCLPMSGVYANAPLGMNVIKLSEKMNRLYIKSDSLVKNSGNVKKNAFKKSSKVLLPDWTKAPNSYIFDPSLDADGLYIPVKKAYVIWEQDKYIGGDPVPAGKVTADVLWEDVHGLIKSDADYTLEIIDSGQDAKIKVPINKAKEGNAVIAFKIDGEIFWSWHVWVTDDPANGSKYKSFPNLKRQRANGLIESIPYNDWGWMDRNLGSVSGSVTSDDWNRNGGLLYQWGRKDPIPPLVYRGNDFYEVSGSIGRVRHRGAKNFTGAVNFDNLRKFVLLSQANVQDNIRLSVKNPLSLIYVNKDDNSGIAYYNNNTNLMVNWFGKMTGLSDSQLPELNLWSDNSQGKINANYNTDDAAQPYRDKSPYDPCPNGWRLPSVLVANLASTSYIDDIRVDFSPYGVRTNMGKNTFEVNNYHIIKSSNTGVPNFMLGFKLYPNIGFNMSNVGGLNMGLYPGTGGISISAHQGQYTDQHHVALWTATMPRFFDATPAVGARALFMIPDKGQPDIPDPNQPNVQGRYWYFPLASSNTSDANACRCVKDPLYIMNDYNFPTEYLVPPTEFREGLENPNTYQMVKSTSAFNIDIPVSKAFSVQNQILNNNNILDPSSYNDLKANVLWTTNQNLINGISIINPSPSSLAEIPNSKISVTINPNQNGNAVITLHNGSVANPVYWSWHIWITDTAVGSYTYTTETPIASAPNYINYVNKADNVFRTEFMDRNLGAIDAFPVVANPLTPTVAELAKIKASTGLHYQWGRKDPLPVFQYADDRTSYQIYLGSVAASGTITYTPLTAAAYNDMAGTYIVPFNTYTNAANANVQAADKVSDKITKVLSYTVKNPLQYLIPSTFAPYNSTIPAYTNGTDWLSNEPNLALDRWGRGGRKSPFDPCPAGWRIPDLTGVAIESNKDFGLTPWYKKDKNVATSYSIISDYYGLRVRRSATYSYTIGYTFNASEYTIGNYPNSGSRGIRSVMTNQSPAGTYNFINFQYPGVWTAALNTNYIGRAINVLFDAAATANRMIVFHDNNDPYFGMSCRCVKIKYDSNGNEEGPIPGLQIPTFTVASPGPVLNAVEIQNIFKEKISIYPNPVKNELHIQAPDNEDGYYYQIYSLSGQLVKSGKFEDGTTDLSSLISGTYLLRINDSKEVVKIIKE
ncbi:Por secretion system C-terminal sorting domain-containing protein [Chryseobacterium sp. RU37D]|uniref:T9SS type A sorting domain-containing protein n=1 Tax=Chryseobacterium sp. RU37D TaxID=1907397 RepID=UPI000954B7F5|nr:T9SS type A sorting domain-containing protein [Chryseobacterium sp. RU37D]SIP93456.1 Por secretion system C-terminal sorting domain-containing protein [Chryseobacterium sp. RU37D]